MLQPIAHSARYALPPVRRINDRTLTIFPDSSACRKASATATCSTMSAAVSVGLPVRIMRLMRFNTSAAEAGLTVIMDRCPVIEYRRLGMD